MEENPYKAPDDRFTSAKARNWKPFTAGVATGCAIAAVLAIIGIAAIGVAVSIQVQNERRRFLENDRARRAAEMANEKARAAE